MVDLRKSRQRLADCLRRPVTECWQFLLMGAVAWLVLFHLTQWTADPWWMWLPAQIADLYVVALLVCLLPKGCRKWVLGVVSALMYVLFFAESFVYQRYYTHFTPQVLSMVCETTSEESSGFLKICLESPKLLTVAAWWFGVAVVHVALGVAVRRPIEGKRLRRALLAVVAVCMVWRVPSVVETVRFLTLSETGQAERTDFSAFHSSPWRIVYSLKFAQLAQGELQNLADNMRHMEVEKSGEGVPCIVLVVGESYNKHHSAVYGYGLPTTPFQSKAQEDGLMVAMKDAVTPWNVTSMVFKQLMSIRAGGESEKWTDGVLFPALMRKGGYRVSFLSNQFYKSNRQNTANFNGSFFLNSQPFDSLCFDERNAKHYVYDMGLVASLPKSPVPGNQFVILHLLGQHQPYADRVPKKQAKFKASDIKRRDLTADERQIVADYDNATLANDSVLEAIYNRFADREAIIIYVADHGEEVYDGSIGTFGRNHSASPTPQIMWAEFEVPLEIFFTPALAEKRPQLVEAALAAQDKPCSIDNLPHTLLGLAGIKSKHYNPQHDLLSAQFKASRRPVKGMAVTYDEIMKRKKQSPTP
jgi:heptose-I-phosphate ethanolaminephosphotransferase